MEVPDAQSPPLGAIIRTVKAVATRDVVPRGTAPHYSGCRRVRAAFPDETLAIVSGGILLTLYLAAVQNLPTPDPAVWGVDRHAGPGGGGPGA